MGNTVQPVRDGLSLADRAGLTSQDQKGGLNGIFGLLFVVQDLPAGVPHEPAVALYEGGEGSFVSGSSEALQELGIAQLANACRTDQFADVLDNSAKLHLRHFLGPAGKSCLFI
jgi:hypothetical protein